MSTLTKTRKTKSSVKKNACLKCGEPFVAREGAAPRCRVCQPLSGTYKLGAGGLLERVSNAVPGLSRGGSASSNSPSEGCGEGACGMEMGGCGGGGCC